MTVTTEKRSSRAIATQQWMERARSLATLLNLHIAGVILLVLVNLYLLVQITFAWQTTSSHNAAAFADQTVAMKTAEIAKRPLEGLDEKLVDATKDSDKFYKQRLPYAISEVAGELGALTKKQGVKLIGVQYAYTPVMPGTAGELTQAGIDARLSGDYRPLMLFINSLERDKMFFLINAVSLVGQQSGTVGLRLRLTTYLRSPVGTESTDKDVVGTSADENGPVAAAPGTPAVPAKGGRP